ncbi:MAG: hypothetical protein EA428_04575 [Spirochaetaceae bacterium]|nr:MAG: hypothetical protein EA428_04575 [Spirochaetaceae bacterium]
MARYIAGMTRIRRAHLGLAVATVALYLLVSNLADFPILDTEWYADATRVYLILGELSSTQLQLYRTMLAVDFMYAIAYAGFLALSVRYFALEKLNRPRLYQVGAIAAVFAAFFDYIENVFILVVINSLPDRLAIADSLGVVTTAKWVAVGLSLAVLLLAALLAGVARLKQQRAANE